MATSKKALRRSFCVASFAAKGCVFIEYAPVNTLQKAKALPCVFNNFGVFYKGKFETVHLLLDMAYLKRILQK